MTERDKIINIVEQNKYCDVNTAANCRECKYSKELENYKDMGCSSLKTADALIAAHVRDITERGWIFMNGEAIVPTPEIYNKVAELLDCPKIEEGEMTEEIEAWKARVKELEEEYNELQNALVKLCNQAAKTAVATGAVAIDKATLEFFPCKSDWSGSCKKCYFASGNYPHDTCRCENNQHHWVSAAALTEAGGGAVKEITKRIFTELRDCFVEQTAYAVDYNQHTGYRDYEIKVGDVVSQIIEIAEKYGVELGAKEIYD